MPFFPTKKSNSLYHWNCNDHHDHRWERAQGASLTCTVSSSPTCSSSARVLAGKGNESRWWSWHFWFRALFTFSHFHLIIIIIQVIRQPYIVDRLVVVEASRDSTPSLAWVFFYHCSPSKYHQVRECTFNILDFCHTLLTIKLSSGAFISTSIALLWLPSPCMGRARRARWLEMRH